MPNAGRILKQRAGYTNCFFTFSEVSLGGLKESERQAAAVGELTRVVRQAAAKRGLMVARAERISRQGTGPACSYTFTPGPTLGGLKEAEAVQSLCSDGVCNQVELSHPAT